MPEPASLSFQDFCIRLGVPAGCISNSTAATENHRTFSIERQAGDQVWRVMVDHCWLHDQDSPKTDYMFWCQCASGQKYIFLVELKGRDFSHALEQIEAMLVRLCRNAQDNIVHRRDDHHLSPGHNPSRFGGVRAYVVLSKGSEVQINQVQIAKIRKRYNVIVHPKSVRQEVSLPLREGR